MSQFVVDNSVVMSWAFEDEENSYADAVLDSLETNEAIVPPIWPLEVANVLVVAQRNERLMPSDERRFVRLLQQLPISRADSEASIHDWVETARETGLSAYDASYLDLALSHNVPLATLDQQLRRAARQTDVDIWLE
ncbi:MAG: type II toxin-antitoxin system VapC family toxin [Planctomycetota bacterium]